MPPKVGGMDSPASRPSVDRFDRQIRFAPLGRTGQERIESARVVLIGCGALGGVLAQTLARAGVGELVLVDRDIVELTNLPRQVLFDDAHAAEGRPKALAAQETLERMGGPTRITPHAVHVDAGNLGELSRGCALILDGTDNLETRYLVNDYAIESGTPWIYAGVVGGSGLVMPVLPGASACLRCVFPEPPAAGAIPSCQEAGVLGSVAGILGSLMAHEALKWLLGLGEPLTNRVLVFDGKASRFREVPVRRDLGCAVCGEHPRITEPTEEGRVCGNDGAWREDGKETSYFGVSAASD